MNKNASIIFRQDVVAKAFFKLTQKFKLSGYILFLLCQLTASAQSPLITPQCPKSEGLIQRYEWVTRMKIHDGVVTSGPTGYIDFTGNAITSVFSGLCYNIEVDVNIDDTDEYWDEYVHIWLDLNYDGVLNPQTELVFQKLHRIYIDEPVQTFTGQITIPPTVSNGPLYGRMIMRYKQEPELCGNYQYGTTYDFKLNVIGQSTPSITVNTSPVSSINNISASSGGSIQASSGPTVSERGVCWNTTGNPTISDSKTNNGTGSGIFNSILTGLSSNTTYYVRAYGTTACSTTYGSQVSFTTTSQVPSTPSAITASSETSCGGAAVVLTAVGLEGTGYWYSESCGGTLLGTGNSITVYPRASTTYYLRAYNGVFSQNCASKKIKVSILAVKKSQFDVVESSTTSVNTTDIKAENEAIIKDQIAASCDGSADEWMLLLEPAISALQETQSVKDNIRSNLRAKLIEVCIAGGSQSNIFGASTSTTASASGYHSFGEVLMEEFIKPRLNKTKFTDMVNPYLFDGPSREDVKQQATFLTLGSTNADVCSKLATLKQNHQESQAGISLYQYLKNKYKQAMTLSEAELGYLEKSCQSCNYLLEEDITLPVFMEPGAKGYITWTEYSNARSALNAAFESGEFSSSKTNYERILANYMNQVFGFAMSYDQYAAYEELAASNPGELLCNEPPFTNVQIDPYACVKTKLEVAVANGRREYLAYEEEEKRKFQDSYVALAASVKANVYLSAKQAIYHHTLYYYDQAANLVRTVPPSGVKVLDDDAIYRVQKARDYKIEECKYNSIGPNSNSTELNIRNNLAAIIHNSLNNSQAAMEFWAYQAAATGGQLLFSADKQYMVQVCFKKGSINADVFQLSNDGANKVGIVRSNHISGLAANIFPWNHIVLQTTTGNNFVSGALELWLNGKKVTAVSTAGVTGCGWTVGSNPLQMPQNVSLLKHVRTYSRQLVKDEIEKNAIDACLGVSNEANLFSWDRYNVPVAGSETTIAANSTTEFQYQNIYPEHTLTTSYAYNTLNQVLKQNSPDGGESNFWYDEVGRVIFSQNAKQKATNFASYTKYDLLGRIAEVGSKYVYSTNLPLTQHVSNSDYTIFHSSNPTSYEVTQTLYDEPASSFDIQYVRTFDQQNTRNRVSAQFYRETSTVFYDYNSYLNASYYSYDIAGNVKTLWQQIIGLNEPKRIDYEYDLVSGKVNFVSYQKEKKDAFYYQYKYDAENRLTQAYSGTKAILDPTGLNSTLTTPYRRLDASYQYYLHGPLARIELGDEGSKVQGLDYAYTLQGWLKGVNSNLLDADKDVSKDGFGADFTKFIPKDALAYSLGYFKDDYKAIGGTNAPAFNFAWEPSGETGQNLFNGNISNTTLGIKGLAAVGYTYKYDQLNRLTKMRQHDMGTTAWGAINNKYKEDVQNDPNGNILKYDRYGKNGQIDKLSYNYYAGTNRLSHVKDDISGNVDNDLKTQNVNNYMYDEIGNLVWDEQETLTVKDYIRPSSIEWNVYGKIRKVKRVNGTFIIYSYDGSGNRVMKLGSNQTKTFYVRDAQGNSLATYEQASGVYKWKEQNLYGSSRLGMWKPDIDVSTPSAPEGSTFWGSSGKKFYELNNHLGNVLAVVSDKRLQQTNTGNETVIGYEADVLSAQDYYPFGMIMPDRSLSSSSYRYGFNGKENDNDVKGTGNQQDYGMRIYDPRLGKFLSTDPLTRAYPWYTPYQFAGNSPIENIDLDGLEPLSIKNFKSGGSPLFMILKDISVREQNVKKAASAAVFKFAFSESLPQKFIDHYVYGKGATYNLNNSEVNQLHTYPTGVAGVVPKDIEKFNSLLSNNNGGRLTLPENYHIQGAATTGGTLGRFTIFLKGTITFDSKDKSQWSFKGQMRIVDIWDFKTSKSDSKDLSRSDWGTTQTDFAAKYLPGTGFPVSSDWIKVSQSSSDTSFDFFKGFNEGAQNRVSNEMDKSSVMKNDVKDKTNNDIKK